MIADRRRKILIAALTVAFLIVVGILLLLHRSTRDMERFVRPDKAKRSPSGAFIASFRPGPEQNGVATWVVVIADTDGSEVFRDDRAYSARHGVGVTWLSVRDQLWILSSDIGDGYVERREDAGTWTKVMLGPENRDGVPEEVRQLTRRSR